MFLLFLCQRHEFEECVYNCLMDCHESLKITNPTAFYCSAVKSRVGCYRREQYNLRTMGDRIFKLIY